MLNDKPCAGQTAQPDLNAYHGARPGEGRDPARRKKRIPAFAGMIGALLAILSSNTSAAAAEKDEIIVSATKTALPLSEVGSAVTVIDAAELSRRQFQFAADALSQTPGLAIARNGAFGGQAALRIRGEASGRTLVLIDGVVVNDPAAPGGGFNFASLDVADIERIEIIRGPQSILYGSEAIGGVVSIATKRGSGAPEARLFAEGGAFSTFRGGGGVTGGSQRIDYGLSVSGITSDGISRADGGAEADGVSAYTASFNVGARITETFLIETSLRYADARTDFDGFPPPSFNLSDTNDLDETQEVIAAGRALLTLFDGRLENVLTVGYHAIDRANFLGDTVTFEAEGERLSTEYLARVKVTDRVSLVAGAEREETHADTSGIDDDVTVSSIFGLLALKPVGRLTVTAGARRDDHETFGGHTTARATAAYRIEESGLTLRGSWGEGFAAPSLFQLNFVCCGGTTPNRDLKPETSTGWDIGFDQALGDIATLRATWFRQETDEQIDFDFVTGAYVNVASSLRKGVESELALHPHEGLDLSLAYTFIDATDQTTGLALLRQPKHALTANADWRVAERFGVGATLRYNGEERDGGGPIEAWTRVDIRASWAASDKLEVFGRIENVLGADYQDVLGYGEPGLSAFGGLRARI